MDFNICVLKGDGIGPEIVDEALKALDKVGEKFGHAFNYDERLIGGAAIDEFGVPLPQETIDACKASDSVLLGAVGGPKWDHIEPSTNRPERGLLGIRKELNLFANLRPAKLWAPLANACPLKPERLGDGLDLVVCRELVGDVYFGKKWRDEAGAGHDDMNYSIPEVERIARVAFDMARKRRGKVTSVDKRNVLETSRMWREIVHRVQDEEYSDVELEDLLVDNAAMQLISRPADFDVVVTENMFGDILSDEAAQITGSLGMLASASLDDGVSLFGPSAGSAPDIAGLGVANPLAQILSVAMLLTYALDMGEQAAWIESAVARVLDEGWRTRDIADVNTPADKILGTTTMGDKVVAALHIERKSAWYQVFSMLRTFVVVLIGYYFDIADGFRAAMGMMLKSVTDLHLSQLRPGAVLEALPLTRYDWAVLLFGTVVIFTASVIQERSQRTIREILDEKCLALRWAVLLAGIFAVVLMGVYGPGVQASEFVYMQF